MINPPLSLNQPESIDREDFKEDGKGKESVVLLRQQSKENSDYNNMKKYCRWERERASGVSESAEQREATKKKKHRQLKVWNKERQALLQRRCDQVNNDSDED